MTTPQLTSSKANEIATQTKNQLRLNTSRSIYCADCLCGRHFETASREWICPDCNRDIVLDWGYSQSTEPQNGSNQPGATTQEIV